ncbi:MAG: hypothetical protein PHX87_04465 [Candidatus Peribacteraceae bacterium]|nr:hypothetical protein [Candidatus Peribacteraceae bacterium]MDD5742652.1 hypothetical protein [Candidatus Peribacteraceae bacterium]
MTQLDTEAEARAFVRATLNDNFGIHEQFHDDEAVTLDALGVDSLDIQELLMTVEEDCQDLLDEHRIPVNHFHVKGEVNTATTIGTLIAATAASMNTVIEQQSQQEDARRRA